MTTPQKPTKDEALKPCPFCGAGTTQIVENGKMWTGMKYSEPSSVSVRHWCEPTPGQPSRMLERVGKDHASAVAAWNTREALAQPAADDKAVSDPMTKEWCLEHPASAAFVINELANQVDAANDKAGGEVVAWRERFPMYRYRPQDECIELIQDTHPKPQADQPAEPSGITAKDQS